MLEKLEMHDIQDKTRLLEEMNETRDGVNKALASVDKLSGDDKDLNRIVKKLEERVMLAIKKALTQLHPAGPKATGAPNKKK